MLLYETLSQPIIFLIFFLVGLASGLIFDLRNYLSFLCAKNKVVNIFLDVIFTVIVCGIFLFSNLIFNYGSLRVYAILSFSLGFVVQRFTIGLFVVKMCSWCYNNLKVLMMRIVRGRIKEKKDVVED